MSMNWTMPYSIPAATDATWRRRVAIAVRRSLTAFMQWRLEQIAIAHLDAMSDRDLKDIGLIRSEIDRIVRLAPTDWNHQTVPKVPQTKWRGVTRGNA
jgi:uncharacterized protein YjiS (DUF1127 family)